MYGQVKSTVIKSKSTSTKPVILQLPFVYIVNVSVNQCSLQVTHAHKFIAKVLLVCYFMIIMMSVMLIMKFNTDQIKHVA